MRVRVAYTVEVSDDYRRAVNLFYGRPGVASRAEVVRWYQQYGESMDVDLMEMLAHDERHGGES